jgi:DNA repair protein RecN (Recombination protein N)
MLAELSIRDFAIIDRLELAIDPGFNVLTGETGAGKSIVIDAVSLLLGGRADATAVRAGAEVARVEGAFALGPALHGRIDPILQREALEGDDPERLVLAREIRREGRTIARVNGRTVTLALLKEIGQHLVDVHGQSEHLSLLRVKEHVHLLDRFAGLEPAREGLAELVRRLRGVRAELDRLISAERDRARRVDQLRYQIEEIRSARLKAGEEETLAVERTRLANAEQLAALADEAFEALAGGSAEQAAALDSAGQAVRALAALAKIDPKLVELHAAAESAVLQLDDVAASLRDYREQIEYNPRRLEQIEDRLDLLKRLRRKYGDNIADILAFAAQAEAELATLEHSEERIAVLRAEEEELLGAIGRSAVALSQRRRAAAVELARGIEAELDELRMAGARFGVQFAWVSAARGAPVPGLAGERVRVQPGDKGSEYVQIVTGPAGAQGAGREAATGEAATDQAATDQAATEAVPGEVRLAFDALGVDRIEFLVAPNVGEGLKPLARIASGGETSRLMLALKTVLARADETPTLIFDEIDQGIGGRVGRTVGVKLWGLTGQGPAAAGAGYRHQVLCITHLPQLAGYGDAHYKVEKHVRGERTVTEVRRLEEPGRLGELAAMLGAEGSGAEQSARDIMTEAARVKGQPAPAVPGKRGRAAS